MATTSGNLLAGTAINGQGGGGKGGRQNGLMTKVAAGVAALGCAAALVFGGLRGGEEARTGAQSGPAVPISGVSDSHRRQFLAWNTDLPDGTAPAAVISADRQHFLAWNVDLPGGAPLTALMSAERQQFLSWNTFLSHGGLTATAASIERQRFLDLNDPR